MMVWLNLADIKVPVLSSTRPQGSTALLDQLIANAWPAQEEVRESSWRFRWAQGVTRRANSVLAAGAPDQIPELVVKAEQFYTDRGGKPRFQVSTASAAPGLARQLQACGYTSDVRTLVQTATTETVHQRTDAGAWTAEISDHLTDEWFAAYWTIEASRGQGTHEAEMYRSVLLNPTPPSRYVTVAAGGEICAVGQVVLEEGWGGVQCLATAPHRRRQGAAWAVLHHLAEHTAACGADDMYLAVVAENTGAQRLYERIGFSTAHEYSYYERP